MILCEKCIEDGREITATEDEFGSVLCENCRTSEAEAAHERMLEDYYGGSGPVTLNERSQAEAAIKRSQR